MKAIEVKWTTKLIFGQHSSLLCVFQLMIQYRDKSGTSVLRADVFFPCLKFVLEKGAAIACVSSSILKAALGTELYGEL